MKPNYSYHNHTYRCGHAHGREEQYIESAIEEGVKYLGISDHCPFKGINIYGDRMRYEELEEYLAKCEELKEKYADQIEIFTGFEVEFLKDRIDEIQELYNRSDYLLLGHHLKELHHDHHAEYTYYCSDSDVLRYAKEVCEGLETGMFAVLNHPDYFMLGRKCWNEACEEAAHMICECAKRCDVPLEINLKGMRRGKHRYRDGEFYPYPYRRFFEIAAEHGNACVYGHDAHAPLDFVDDRELALSAEILKGLDLNILESFDIKAYRRRKHEI